ncbi:hypothetical protein D9619_012926 [Psilocybe cf. subviscida]|uniref:Amidohydrolase-related domain-containing protein n=1 Tax=Psilocybe cf. subviscida TaxID=2480587 RepID=A0A8H5F501_9AGAR|nr:hypothetical protein D9619_012926 [Psilocybe cf. subviscida]
MEKGALSEPDATYNEKPALCLRRLTTPKTTLARRLIYLCTCALLLQAAVSLSGTLSSSGRKPQSARDPEVAARRAALVAKCNDVNRPAGPPASFTPSSRLRSADRGNERWVPGTPPVLIKNARIWTGEEIIEHGDVFVERGLVVAAGFLPPSLLYHIKSLEGTDTKVEIIDAHGRWLTPGLVDIHSHLGVNSAPALSGAFDGNSRKAPILPWLRSVDGLNTHDDAYRLSIAGGVTTAQVLPGSANNIGGQSFVIKLRETQERSTTSRVLEPPETLVGGGNGTEWVHWRHMKHACGENPDRVYSQTRMDGQWNFRHAYDTARILMLKQDKFCAKVAAGEWDALRSGDQDSDEDPEFPEDLQWESLVDVLRGKVKLSIHCYEAVDLDGIVRLSNEFSFPVASFHHAGETYLVPDLLKKTWGGAPVASLFASNFKKKREAYRGSEFAPRVLAEHGIPVVMKSDHPVMNSRYLMFEAQQAHYYGLDPILALASVTSTPAKALGLGHRVGSIAEGYDADLVLWDSHPLALGATPTQVFIDGIAQLPRNAPVLRKSHVLQRLPKVPNFDKEKNATVEWQGEMPLRGRILGKGRRVRVVGIAAMDIPGQDGLTVTEGGIKTVWESTNKDGVVVIEDGRIVCASPSTPDEQAYGFPSSKLEDDEEEVVDLRGGELRLGLTTYGAPIGLVEIRLEASTNDGNVRDPLIDQDPPTGLVHAVDGLAFEGRNMLLAYRSGITMGITAPTGSGFIRGVSAAFSLGAPHALANGAIQQSETALHISLSYNSPKVSVSTQVAALRRLLLADDKDEDNAWTRGDMTLVVSVENADIMATLLSLKAEYEESTGQTLEVTFSGGTEAHLLADEIAAAGVSVILTKLRPYPGTWEQRRILPGPPLTEKSALATLLDAGVNAALGVADEAEARNTLFELAWASLDSNGTISRTKALSLVSTNLHKALGYERPKYSIPDIVMYHGGGILDFQSKVVGVISATRRVIELF